MTEELKQKAKDFIDRINKESDGMWLNNYYLSDLLVMFATEATKKLEKENTELRNNGFSVSDMTEQQLKVAIEKDEQLEKKIAELKCECRRCVEKIDREVQLSKMAEDNRMVISALGFAVVPPKPKVDVKEV